MYAMPSSSCFDASSACLALSLTSSVSGSSGCTARTSSAGEVPSLAAIEMLSNWPSRSSTRCAVSRSHAAMVPKPSESTSPYDTVPLMR